ncbi:MAG TPA: Gfo/Idh/MocA family oxidoreductase [Beijerinckiaceae bacterium]|nr:Gfo/Idh/MocA family oxidoreductase [Beijerinckiaceae bacterium]
MRGPRLGLLGVGWIGRHRMQAIVEADVADVVAIADSSPEMAAEAQKLAPRAKLVATLDQILDAQVDGVVIATPSAMHAEQSIRALSRGIAVFCQKPLGRNAAEAQSVIDSARAADRLIGVDFSYRHTQGMQRIAEIAGAGELGHIFAIDLVFHNAYGPDKAWFYDPGQSGGGCVMDLGVHLVDLALWVMAFPEVTSVTSKLFAGGELLVRAAERVEDYATATLQLSSGTAVRLACSWRLQAGRDAIISAAFYGTNGGAALHNVDGSFYDFVAERYRGTAREMLANPPDAWGGRAAVDWARRLAGGARFHPEAVNLVRVSRVLDQIYGRAALS